MKKTAGLLIMLLVLVSLPSGQDEEWSFSAGKVDEIVSLIDRNYFKPTDREELVYASIRGALDTLDPHSYFLDPEVPECRRITACYYGLGIQIMKYEDRLVVVSPIEAPPTAWASARRRHFPNQRRNDQTPSA
jgi:carboxyl-terminal processing protease